MKMIRETWNEMAFPNRHRNENRLEFGLPVFQHYPLNFLFLFAFCIHLGGMWRLVLTWNFFDSFLDSLGSEPCCFLADFPCHHPLQYKTFGSSRGVSSVVPYLSSSQPSLCHQDCSWRWRAALAQTSTGAQHHWVGLGEPRASLEVRCQLLHHNMLAWCHRTTAGQAFYLKDNTGVTNLA